MAKAPVELEHQMTQGSAAEIKVHTRTDAQVFAEGQCKPATHGVGADQHLLGLQWIVREALAQLSRQGSCQLLDAVAADQAKHRLIRPSL